MSLIKGLAVAGNLSSKRQEELHHWDRQRLLRLKEEKDAWFRSEVSYIKGMIHRATRKPLADGHKVLQIGAGPNDVIDYWSNAERHALDPLAEEYRREFADLCDMAVNYVAGVGENIPFADDSFDVIVIRNALDHVEDPYKVLAECYRTLKPTGALYVWTYCYSWRGRQAYRLVNLLTRRYQGEPWAFTYGAMLRALTRAKLMPALPAREDRPVHRPESRTTRYWINRAVHTVLGYARRGGFTCVALPDKGTHVPWRLPGG